jgi:hypothetical protein
MSKLAHSFTSRFRGSAPEVAVNGSPAEETSPLAADFTRIAEMEPLPSTAADVRLLVDAATHQRSSDLGWPANGQPRVHVKVVPGTEGDWFGADLPKLAEAIR